MSRPNILVIDDEPHVAMLVELAGRTWGYDVVGAGSLEEGRSLLGPDTETRMLLLDVRLPDGSGLDLLEELRQDPRFKDLPIIILTGIGEDNVVQRAESGGARCITKPFSPTKLGRMVADILGLPEPQP
jgi:DNA-binding response OmpR family regulator